MQRSCHVLGLSSLPVECDVYGGVCFYRSFWSKERRGIHQNTGVAPVYWLASLIVGKTGQNGGIREAFNDGRGSHAGFPLRWKHEGECLSLFIRCSRQVLQHANVLQQNPGNRPLRGNPNLSGVNIVSKEREARFQDTCAASYHIVKTTSKISPSSSSSYHINRLGSLSFNYPNHYHFHFHFQ